MTEKTFGRKVVRGTTKKNAYFHRLLIVLGACFIIGFIFGSIVIGIAVHKHDMKKITTTTISESEAEIIENQPFASSNNKVFTSEMSINWSSGEEFGFVPLDVPLDEDLQEFVFCLSYGYNIDWTLVMAMIEHESSFRSDLISNTNDYGLMQINIQNHEWLTETIGVTDFLDAKQNIRSGLFVLRKLFEKYGDNTNMVLMAYNMGENGASRLWNQEIYSTSYSEEIMQKQAEFQQKITERNGEEE